MLQQKKQIFTQNKNIYVLEGIIGRGTGGQVYKAFKPNDQQIQYVALKIQSQIEDQEYQILQDLKNNNQLKHVVNILDIDRINNSQIIIVMDLASGTFLEYFQKNQAQFDEEQILQYFQQIVIGTCELHQLQLIHRDLKLENVVYVQMQNKIHLKICDTGLIRKQGGRKTMMVGTPYYMAPEQINQSIYDERVDIWSLGMILFEMISKQTLVKGTSIQEVLNTITRLNQDYINFQIDNLNIKKIEYQNGIKELLKQMIMIDKGKRLRADIVLKYLQRILQQNVVVQNSNNLQNNDIKERMRLEIEKEFEQIKKEEFDKLSQQHKLEKEQFRQELIEQNKIQINQEILRMRQQLQDEFKISLEIEAQKKLQQYQQELRIQENQLNIQQINQIKQKYEEEKINYQKQQEIIYQSKIQEEILKIKNNNKLQEEVIQQQLQNQDQFMKMQLQEQLAKRYQQEFEQKSKALIEYSKKLTNIEQNLNQGLKLITNEQNQLKIKLDINPSMVYKTYISEYQKKLQGKYDTIQDISKQLDIIKNQDQSQIHLQIYEKIKQLNSIQTGNQDLLNPQFLEQFIQSSNQQAKEILLQQQQIYWEQQQDKYDKITNYLSKSMSNLKQELDKLNKNIHCLVQIEKQLQQELDSVNQEFQALNLGYQLFDNIIGLSKKGQLMLDNDQKYDLEFQNHKKNFQNLEHKLKGLLQRVQKQHQDEIMIILEKLEQFQQSLDNWEQRIKAINQNQSQHYQEENKDSIQQLGNKIISLINDIKANQNLNPNQKFQIIKQEFEICIFKVEQIDNYYQKEIRKQNLSPLQQQQIKDSQNSSFTNLNNQLKFIQNNFDNLSQQFNQLYILSTNKDQLLQINKEIEIKINILRLLQNSIQPTQDLINNFNSMIFDNFDKMKLEECQIKFKINLISEQLDPFFPSLNEIKKQLNSSQNIDMDNNLKHLKNLLLELQRQLDGLRLQKGEQEHYNNFDKEKNSLKQDLINNSDQCDNFISQNTFQWISLYQYDSIKTSFQENREQLKTNLQKIDQKISNFQELANQQKQRLNRLDQQIQQFDQKKIQQFLEDYINQYQDLEQKIQILLTNISCISINEYHKNNELVEHYRKDIIRLQQIKSQNCIFFQNLNFYTNQIKVLKFIDALFQLYLLHNRFFVQYNKSIKRQRGTQSINQKLNEHQICLVKIKQCFDSWFSCQEEILSLNILVRNINDYLTIDKKFQNENQYEQVDNDKKYNQLLTILENKIIDLKINLNNINKVKIQGKIKQSQQPTQPQILIKNLKETFQQIMPYTNHIIMRQWMIKKQKLF